MEVNLLKCVNSSNKELTNVRIVSDEIAKITNGFGLFNGFGVHWANCFTNSPDKKEREFFILNKKQFKGIQNYFDSKGFNYSYETEKISLCCEDSTKKMQLLNANFYLDNGYVSKASFIYSPNELSTLNVRAYFDNFGRKEELLQKALVQNDIYLRDYSEYSDLFHCSSSFKIFKSLEEAVKTIDDEMFSYLKETIKRGTSGGDSLNHYDGAFIIGHEYKYRLPLTLSPEILKKDYNSLENICAIGMVGGPPKVLATHEDGITIVTDDRTTELPLKRYFNPSEGICFDLGMWKESVLHNHYLGCCESCKETKIEKFRDEVINNIEEFKISDSIIFELVSPVAKKIGYEVNYNNLKVNIVEKEKRFN